MKFSVKDKKVQYIIFALGLIFLIVIAVLFFQKNDTKNIKSVKKDNEQEEVVKNESKVIEFISSIAGLQANNMEVINNPVVGVKGEIFAPKEAIINSLDYYLKHTKNDKMSDVKVDIGDGYIVVNVNYNVTNMIKTPIEVKVIPSLDENENLVLNIKEVRLLDLKITNWIVNLALDNFIKDWFPADSNLKVDFNNGNILVYKENFKGVTLKEIDIKETGLKVNAIIDLNLLLN
ncbi:hypothetical protein ACH36K_11485 [Clostridium sp. MB05]|uniref:hypothetical protein n=1 Tax=Clostridium sp. MB05 TaxID=3376682 RepID=UPI0039824EF8